MMSPKCGSGCSCLSLRGLTGGELAETVVLDSWVLCNKDSVVRGFGGAVNEDESAVLALAGSPFLFLSFLLSLLLVALRLLLLLLGLVMLSLLLLLFLLLLLAAVCCFEVCFAGNSLCTTELS